MILGRVLDYLAANRVASPTQIAAGIGSTPDAVRGMLGTLQRRGLVRSAGCGAGCRQCTEPELEMYTCDRQDLHQLAAPRRASPSR